MTKRTLQGTNKRALGKSGYRARLKTKSGRDILKKRRTKGRRILSLAKK